MSADVKPDSRMRALARGEIHDPFEVLGRHPLGDGEIVRAMLPQAERAWLEGGGEMQRVPDTDIFEYRLTSAQAPEVPRHYRVEWQEKGDGGLYGHICPYSFKSLIGDDDLHYFGEGRHHHAYRFLGAHPMVVDDIEGVRFAVWAPGAKRVSVVGDFNGWHGLRNLMRVCGGSGVWDLFVPGLQPGDLYKFEIVGPSGTLVLKIDPYAFQMTPRPDTACQVARIEGYPWGDGEWMQQRAQWDWQHEPVSMYEVHLGSWRQAPDGGFLSYRAIAERLVPYVKEMGFTHVELMPVMEHPLDQSWGYQVTGYYAPTARFGDPDGLRYLIDSFHQAGIGVILDWVPGHFPRDDYALARFLGEPLYEHADPRRGEHRDWGTLIFDYGRKEVANFLLSNVVYWLEEFHVDGLRVDAVASMLYLDYSRAAGDWLPNVYGGRENLDAIAFLQEMNQVVHARFPGAITVAEESTAWPMVSRPIEMGGLGFSMKWNMGWMNDTLSYFQHNPVHRAYHHHKLTFGQVYAYTENFVLPLSHDEVVHMKRSLLDKMPGDSWQKFANLRLLLGWQMAHPGKKLLFMGAELAQWVEWDESASLDWSLLHHDTHRDIQKLVCDLNRLYRDSPALHRHDFEQQGFEWLDCKDEEQSILAFVRRSSQQTLACLMNFTPVPRPDYLVPMPQVGSYQVIFNSDSEYYGGSNLGNGTVVAKEDSRNGRPASAKIDLPPLGILILQPE